MSANTVWGIDLGTTYSCIAHVDESGYPVVVNNDRGEPTTPSVVLFSSPDDVTVGADAKAQIQLVPDLVCELVKQNMGNPDWRFSAHGKEWTAPEVSAFTLKELVRSAEKLAGEKIEDVVITVPAYFGVVEREATIDAGKIAGLNVRNIINEPTAAAFSYGFAQSGGADETVLVYDLGGGTFDVTVIRLEPGANGGSSIRVAATSGDDRLGGALWDQRLVELLARKFVEAAPEAMDPLDDPQASADLRMKAEGIKRSLSTRESHTEIVIAGTERAQVTVTREEFEDATKDLLEQTIQFTRDALADAAKAGAPDVDRVLLVGGSSFMPAVTRRLTEEFPGWNPELSDPNQAVAKGAALAGLQQALIDSIDDTSSAEQVEAAALDRGVSQTMVHRLVNTDFVPVCARGFGIRSIREGVDVAARPEPLPDGDYQVVHIIRPQTPLPVTDTEETFYTVVDNQSAVDLQIWEQASHTLASDISSNKFLEKGLFRMTRAYPRSTPIHVTMGMAADGTLRVHATDVDGGRLDFEATASNVGMSPEELEASASKVQAMRQGE